MAKKVSEVVVKYSLDDPSMAKTQRKVEQLHDVITDSRPAAAIGTLGKQFAEMGDKVGTVEQRAKDLRDTLETIGASQSEIAANVAEFEKLTAAVKETAEEVERVIESEKKVGTASATSGGGGLNQSIFSKVQRAAGGVGLGGVADIAGFADDFSDLAGALSAAGVAVGPLVAALAPLVAVTGLVAAGFVAVTKVFRDGATDIDNALDALQVYYDTIGDGTTESINGQIDKINKQKSLDKQFLDQIVATQNELRTNSGNAVTDVSKTLVSIFGASGLQAKADELAGKVQKADESLVGLNLALGSNAVAVNDAEAAAKARADAEAEAEAERTRIEKEEADKRKAVQDDETNRKAEAARKLIALDTQLDELKAKGTSAQVAEQAQATNQLAIQRQKELDALYALPEQTESTIKQIQELEEELNLLDYQSARLEGDVKKVVDARQGELDAYAKLKKSVDELAGGLTGAAGKAASLAKGVLDAVTEAGTKRAKSETDAATDIAKINEQASERRADLEKRYADNLVKITEDAANSATKALQKLQQTQDDLRRDLGRADDQATRKLADDQLSAQIDAQREESQALQDHLRNLQKIRQDAQDREFELAVNRDFAGLFFSRRDTNKQLNNANGDFNAERGQRQTDLQAKLSDLAREAEQERRERNIQFQQRLADNRANYAREVAEIEANRQQQLARTRAQYATDQAELSAALAKQLAVRRAAYRAEIDEINKATALRLRIELQAQSGLIQGAQRVAGIVGSLFSAITSGFGKPVKRAGGGGLGAGQWSSVNEPESSGNESWMTGGKRYAFPGPGLFLPSQGGTVDSGRGSSPMTINMPINISGSGNPQATAVLVRKEVAGALRQIIKR